ncbi:MAG: glycosyltransferase family 2 protein [Patescibacteria group bacterium]
MKCISFVIPLYNAAASVRELTARILTLPIPEKIEIVYVDDGSTDTTDAIVRSLAASDKRIKYVTLTRNYGQHNAILMGLRKTQGDAVVCLDDDLQTPPEETLLLLATMRRYKADAVYGQYETNEDTFRRIGTRLHNLMAEVFGKPKEVTLTSFFYMKRAIAKNVSRYRGSWVYLPALVFRTTGNVRSIRVKHQSRKYGSSGYTFFRLTKLWIIGVLVYLRLADLFRSKPAAVIKDSVNLTSTHH